jgi:cytochrome c oxidase assembly protein subunit 15
MNKSQNPVIIWLMVGALLVVFMVVIGGITRLTQSGLSMVEWNLVMGSIPPMNETEWQQTFEKYKQSPEFNIVNYEFDLEDFKSIFWWEYIHRMLGRLIGLVFIFPFFIFLYQKRIDKPLLKKLISIFILGAFQGFLGWYMVKSGLVKDPHVSHYRLAAHLIAALTLFCLILLTALELIFKDSKLKYDPHLNRIRKLSIAGTILLTIQIIYGAFVAGLKAGLYYNTWPKMGIKWVPSEVGQAISRDGFISLVDNITVVQFIHRYLAWIVAIIVIMMWAKVRRRFKDSDLWPGSQFLVGMTVIQILLGIFTLVYQVPVSLGVIHQLGSVLLLGGFVFIIQRSESQKPN